MQKKVWKKPQKKLRKRKSKIYKEEKDLNKSKKELGEILFYGSMLQSLCITLLWQLLVGEKQTQKPRAACFLLTVSSRSFKALLKQAHSWRLVQLTLTGLKRGHTDLCAGANARQSDQTQTWCSTCSLKVLINTVNMGRESERKIWIHQI